RHQSLKALRSSSPLRRKIRFPSRHRGKVASESVIELFRTSLVATNASRCRRVPVSECSHFPPPF
ncbi:MAG: hypothetical protein QW279_12240, partial [Candidatus Jordarchaeaceae archaeon]